LISRIDMSEVFTRVLWTFITKLYSMIQKTRASFFYKRAFLISWSTPCAVRHTNPLAFHIMFHRKVPTTHIAIHSTGSYKLLNKQCLHFFTRYIRLNQLFCHRYNNI
jgi:hypothetical protein